MKVLFLSSEATPFAKTGGLADVAGSLPSALSNLGLDVRLALPFYRQTREQGLEARTRIRDLEVPLGNETLTADVLEAQTKEDVPVYLIEREDLFDRPNLYGNARGDYYDNLERFTFFCRAALMLISEIAFSPDVFHCHDWQTGLVPALLRGPTGGKLKIAKKATVFTIHNLGYQGLFPATKLSLTGLPREGFLQPSGLEYWGSLSLLKAGIVYSDAVTTVSPTYAMEIQTKEYGMGMEGILADRQNSLHGILNGIDYDLWDPMVDKHIEAHYSAQDLKGRDLCRKVLIREMGLSPSLGDRPLLGMISRLDNQKGLDLLVAILAKVLDMGVGLVVLGSGEDRIQQAISEAAHDHPGQVGSFIGFNEALAHRIMAGADIFLMPSRYEPCGLTQMYALRYGAVPVVRATGGLNDTIAPFDLKTGEGNGFKFVDYSPEALLDAIRRAVDAFNDKQSWIKLISNGMKADFSWQRSARKYSELYAGLVGDGP